uniref:Uncharacterized protein n=1 Tax=Arundo donax TaxID=35708 RepID=A0A0A9GD01_ARUDO
MRLIVVQLKLKTRSTYSHLMIILS